MSQRGIRPWSLMGHGSRTSKHSGRSRKDPRVAELWAGRMDTFWRIVLARLPHRLSVLREQAGYDRNRVDIPGEWKRKARTKLKAERRAARFPRA